MNYRFLLDENVFYQILESSSTCLQALTLLVQKCHKVVFTSTLIGKYWEIIKKVGYLKNKNIAHLLTIWLRDVLTNRDKYILEEKLKRKLPTELRERLRQEKREEPDLLFIDLAITSRSLLVSNNLRLIKKFKKIGVPSEYLDILTCEEVLQLISNRSKSPP